MYRTTNKSQEEVENFELPFGGRLSQDNRWVRLAKLIPWSDFETEYATQFSRKMGAPAKPFRMALGALIIKERLGTSDEETVEQIRGNPCESESSTALMKLSQQLFCLSPNIFNPLDKLVMIIPTLKSISRLN